ncbi:hypothetical protein SAMN05216317_10263 [Nitrosomonas eutropha]|uniref:hypothetical protein n=1 Tax=Nitrosomonas TaxID=914 RepID=UPI00089B5B8A|nr:MULTISPECIES: hypothetical protein [Nitrosomonas]SDW09744.1 hypothetical protein SAMN05216317_10263 [Nitrosomonas eutropha]
MARPILDPEAFAHVHIAECRGVEWFDTEFGQSNIYAWAKEQAGETSHETFGDWMHRNNLIADHCRGAGNQPADGKLLPYRAQSHPAHCLQPALGELPFRCDGDAALNHGFVVGEI